MAMATSGGSGLRSDMNVTPMIDVLLVLIITFLIIMPVSRGEDALIPQPQNDPNHVVEPEKTIVVQVLPAADGKRPLLKINDQPVAWDNLEEELHRIFDARSAKVALLQGAREIDFEYVADVIDTAHRAGVVRVGLMSVKQSG